MKGKYFITSESVGNGHPDKVCDQISDAVLDAVLKNDPKGRVACETFITTGLVVVGGEITTKTYVNIQKLVKEVLLDIGYSHDKYGFSAHTCAILNAIVSQSPDISQGVDSGGAGDQGIMIGYACNETKNYMPLEYELARNLCCKIYKKYPYDGKTQVTLGDNKVLRVVASFQNTKAKELENLVKSIIKSEEYIINPAGDWKIGGFEADSGLTGRKLIVDSYGPRVPVGGGSFSGKDPTKVDRSGAYMARRIAVDYLKKYKAKEVLVKLAYAIGQEEPLMKSVVINGKEREIEDYDLKPNNIIESLYLRNPIYTKTSQWGHFGNGFKWDC